MERHVGKLTASRRERTGKEVAKKLRQRELIPAVVYGGGGESEALTLDPLQLHAALDPQKKGNTLIELTIEAADGKSPEQQNVMVKQHQVHPLRRNVMHVDLVRVSLDQPVQVEVPLHTEGRAEGVQLGGMLNQVFRTLPLECTPDKIPAEVTVDVSALNIGDGLQVSDLTLPEGVTTKLAPEQTVVAVVASRAVAEEETTEEGAEATEGEAAASDSEEAASAAS